MLLDLVGGQMNAEPAWAMSVAEIESVGLSGSSARAAVGVSPAFDLEGRWVLLVDDEPYDAKTARVIEITGEDAVDSRGNVGSVQRLRKVALIRFPAVVPGRISECIAISSAAADDLLSGMIYSGVDLPSGDPGALWDAIEDEEDPPYDDLPMAMIACLFREERLEGLPPAR